MNYSHLKISIRNARKNGVISFAKIIGLSISFAVILLAVSYVFYETSFDKDVSDGNRIYRCLMQGQFPNEKVDYAVTSPKQGPTLVEEIPEIIESLRIKSQGEVTLVSNNQEYINGKLFYTDPNFFSFWGIPIKSNLENPLADNNYLIISKSVALKQFGTAEAALGKAISLRNEECVITGVFADIPQNFHLQIDFFQSLKKSHPEKIGWDSQSYYTYIKTVQEGIDINKLNFKISKTVYMHDNQEIDAANAQSMDDLKYTDNIYLFYTTEPLADIHFSKHKFDPANTANKTYVYGGMVLALLVLMISSTNFVNLSIANLSTRLKEVGIRKTIGALKSQILYQFMSETFVFFIVSFVIALVLYVYAGKQFTYILGFDISLNPGSVFRIISISFSFLLAFILLIFLFPVLATSNNKISSLLKGVNVRKKTSWSNNGFLMAQFFLSVIIILCSVFVQKQLKYMITKDRGYESENVIMISLWRLSEHQRESFTSQLSSYPIIQSVSSSEVYFGMDLGMNSAHFETTDEENFFHPSVLPVDDAFDNTFNLKMKEGRFFEKNRKADFDAVILNETAVKEYKGEGSLINKDVFMGGQKYKVIGIVKDFNFRSLHHKLEPLLIVNKVNKGNVYLKISMNHSQEAIKILQKMWAKYNVPEPFNFTFLDDILAKNYAKDQQAKKLLLLLSIISIVIACVGLYAISFFTIIKKTKEIGIRKVNGAKITEIMATLNKNFVTSVAIAYFIASPIVWLIMSKWIENFAFKTELSWWVFTFVGLLTMGIALLTISYQSWRAARRNPVEALRYE